MEPRKALSKILENHLTPYIAITPVLCIIIAPIIWTVLTAFKTRMETFTYPPTYLPKEPTLSTLYQVIYQTPLLMYVKNSIIIAGATTIFVVFVGGLTAYGFSQYKFKWSRGCLIAFLATRVIPPISLLLPFYIIALKLGLTNTLQSLVLINIYMCYPLAVWMMKAFFDAFPRELIDSAGVDGCSRIGTFIRIVLPVTAVSIAAVAIITFLWTWDEFIYASLFINADEIKPLTVGAFWYIGDDNVMWNLMCAASFVATLPGIIFFVIAQRFIVKGMTVGAVKG